ncbi:hypothetical protein KsCSTR_33700 [Candidatus Kuenenia stuttgartiensis]|uniref:Uncharacterized protein n=1 Tax=Kuenenia stuttgartiensis TaxID=174633 RepID=A0A6G7GTZ9_KUEST|nr:hypothetical protein KsCSTR_33700 [Candidatus Kuenenia stuttgartiensis]
MKLIPCLDSPLVIMSHCTYKELKLGKNLCVVHSQTVSLHL